MIYNLELVSDVQQSDLVIHIAILFRYFSYIGYYTVSSVLYSSSLWINCLIYSSMYMLIPSGGEHSCLPE